MKKRGAVFLTIFWTAAALAQDGRLCIANDCRDAQRGVVAVAAADVPRAYVWTSTSGKEVIAGSLGAYAASINLGARPALRFQVTSSDDRQWPLPFRVSVGTSEWSIPAGDTTPSIPLLDLPEGNHTLRIAAEHHHDTERAVTITERTADGGRIVLKRFPVLAGSSAPARRCASLSIFRNAPRG